MTAHPRLQEGTTPASPERPRAGASTHVPDADRAVVCPWPGHAAR